MRRRILLGGGSALAVGCTGTDASRAILREGACPCEPLDEQRWLIDAAVAVAVTVCFLVASILYRTPVGAIASMPGVTAVWTLLFGVVLGCAIGRSIAALRSGLPRKPDAVALAALLDRIKKGDK